MMMLDDGMFGEREKGKRMNVVVRGGGHDYF